MSVVPQLVCFAVTIELHQELMADSLEIDTEVHCTMSTEFRHETRMETKGLTKRLKERNGFLFQVALLRCFRDKIIIPHTFSLHESSHTWTVGQWTQN